ncbi:MAG: site-specific integrase [Proteobacteria bacterium]|nr:MAG: site-specific integrase [Pseudomonadota bacterium]
MINIIKSKKFKIGSKATFKSVNGKINYKFSDGVEVESIPTIFDSNGKYIYPVNLWFIHLITVERAKSLNSCLRAIQRYWNFLEKNELKWDHFPESKSLKPTYRFRNQNLLKAIDTGELKASTCSVYINHIISFYEWAINQNFINYDVVKPFEIEFIPISSQDKLGHMNRKYIVRSTDLRIRVPKRNSPRSLNPLTIEELHQYSKVLKKKSIEFQLHQQLQIKSGLRIEEACSFPASLVKPNYKNQDFFEVEIGPFNGVKTKFNKERKIEIHSSLMESLYRYLISERRANRIDQNTFQKHEPLLINKYKKPYSSNSVQVEFFKIRNEFINKDITFNHKTHDLRATYGTYKLASLLKIKDFDVADAMSLVMSWMGHSDEKTTWKYLTFLESQNARLNAISILDQFMNEAINYE